VRTRRTLLVSAAIVGAVTAATGAATAAQAPLGPASPSPTAASSAPVVEASAGAATDPSGGYAPFADGPFGVHEDGIDWLAGSGVTVGCTTSTFCPRDGVSRDQMATFLHRLSGHAAGTPPTVEAATVGGRTAGQLEVINGFVRTTERARITDAVVDLDVTCPPGTQVLGGGGTIDGLFAQVSGGPTADGSGWAVVWVSDDNRTHEVDVTVSATCAPTAPGATASGADAPSDAERARAVDRLRDEVALRRG
jgi:hypothetical protein